MYYTDEMFSLFQNLSPEDDGFFDLLTKFQGRRIDEQRCSLKSLSEHSVDKENGENKPPLKSSQGIIQQLSLYFHDPH